MDSSQVGMNHFMPWAPPLQMAGQPINPSFQHNQYQNYPYANPYVNCPPAVSSTNLIPFPPPPTSIAVDRSRSLSSSLTPVMDEAMVVAPTVKAQSDGSGKGTVQGKGGAKKVVPIAPKGGGKKEKGSELEKGEAGGQGTDKAGAGRSKRGSKSAAPKADKSKSKPAARKQTKNGAADAASASAAPPPSSDIEMEEPASAFLDGEAPVRKRKRDDPGGQDQSEDTARAADVSVAQAGSGIAFNGLDFLQGRMTGWGMDDLDGLQASLGLPNDLDLNAGFDFNIQGFLSATPDINGATQLPIGDHSTKHVDAAVPASITDNSPAAILRRGSSSSRGPVPSIVETSRRPSGLDPNELHIDPAHAGSNLSWVSPFDSSSLNIPAHSKSPAIPDGRQDGTDQSDIRRRSSAEETASAASMALTGTERSAVPPGIAGAATPAGSGKSGDVTEAGSAVRLNNFPMSDLVGMMKTLQERAAKNPNGSEAAKLQQIQRLCQTQGAGSSETTHSSSGTVSLQAAPKAPKSGDQLHDGNIPLPWAVEVPTNGPSQPNSNQHDSVLNIPKGLVNEVDFIRRTSVNLVAGEVPGSAGAEASQQHIDHTFDLCERIHKTAPVAVDVPDVPAAAPANLPTISGFPPPTQPHYDGTEGKRRRLNDGSAQSEGSYQSVIGSSGGPFAMLNGALANVSTTAPYIPSGPRSAPVDPSNASSASGGSATGVGAPYNRRGETKASSGLSFGEFGDMVTSFGRSVSSTTTSRSGVAGVANAQVLDFGVPNAGTYSTSETPVQQSSHSKPMRMIRVGRGGLNAEQVKEAQVIDIAGDGSYLGAGSDAHVAQLVAHSITKDAGPQDLRSYCSTSCAGGGVLSTTGANIITALNGPLPSNLNEMTVKDLKRHTKPAVAALQTADDLRLALPPAEIGVAMCRFFMHHTHQMFPIFHEKVLLDFYPKLVAMYSQHRPIVSGGDTIAQRWNTPHPTTSDQSEQPGGGHAAGYEPHNIFEAAALPPGSEFIIKDLSVKHAMSAMRYLMIFAVSERIASTGAYIDKPTFKRVGAPYGDRVSGIHDELDTYPPSLRKVQILILIALYIGNLGHSRLSIDAPALEVLSKAASTCYAVGLHSPCNQENINPTDREERIRAFAVCRQLSRVASMGVGRPSPILEDDSNKDEMSTLAGEQPGLTDAFNTMETIYSLQRRFSVDGIEYARMDKANFLNAATKHLFDLETQFEDVVSKWPPRFSLSQEMSRAAPAAVAVAARAFTARISFYQPIVALLLDRTSPHALERNPAPEPQAGGKDLYDRHRVQHIKRKALVRYIMEQLIDGGRSVVVLTESTIRNHTITPAGRRSVHVNLGFQALTMAVSIAIHSGATHELPISIHLVLSYMRRARDYVNKLLAEGAEVREMIDSMESNISGIDVNLFVANHTSPLENGKASAMRKGPERKSSTASAGGTDHPASAQYSVSQINHNIQPRAEVLVSPPAPPLGDSLRPTPGYSSAGVPGVSVRSPGSGGRGDETPVTAVSATMHQSEGMQLGRVPQSQVVRAAPETSQSLIIPHHPHAGSQPPRLHHFPTPSESHSYSVVPGHAYMQPVQHNYTGHGVICATPTPSGYGPATPQLPFYYASAEPSTSSGRPPQYMMTLPPQTYQQPMCPGGCGDPNCSVQAGPAPGYMNGHM